MPITVTAQKHIEITSVLLAVAITSVALRFVAHRRARTELRIDDWTLLIALALVSAMYAEGIVCESFSSIVSQYALTGFSCQGSSLEVLENTSQSSRRQK